MLRKPKRGDLANSTAMAVDEDKAVGRGCTRGEKGNVTWRELHLLTGIIRAEMAFQKLPGEVGGLGQISLGKAWKWGRRNSCKYINSLHLGVSASDIFCSVHSIFHSDIELCSGFFTTEKWTQVRHPQRSQLFVLDICNSLLLYLV